MAWMTQADRRRFSSMPNEPDMETLTYWVTRLEPLIRSENEDEIIIVFCNRIGHEDEVTYAGTSAVVGIQDGEVKVYGLLGRGEKELLVVDTNNPPYAKMVYRPDATGDLEGEVKSPSYDIPSDNDESMAEADEYEESSPEQTSRKPSGDYQAGYSPRTTTSDSSRRPRSPEEMEPRSRTPPAISVIASPTSIEDPFAFPAPSEPSTAPQAGLPRLMMPESASIPTNPYLPEPPNSAASFSSQKSGHSVRSNESEASVRTVLSNPRPPENSTPHPAARPQVLPFNEPSTAFDDMSVVEPRWFWPPPNNVVNAAGGWTPGAPIGREPEPFPWSDIASDVHPPSRQVTSTRTNEVAAAQEQRVNSLYPPSNASSRPRISHKASRSDISIASKRTFQEPTGREHFPREPSNPNSRHASRTRAHERSKSSLGQLDVTDAISQYLNDLSQRAESVSRMRSESFNSTPPSQRESTFEGRSRAGTLDSEHEMIQIAFSPGILSEDGRNPSRAQSRNSCIIQTSPSNINVYLDGNEGPSPTAISTNSRASVDAARQPPRAMSRGRARKPDSPLNGNDSRASSIDSNKNDRLHSRIRRGPISRDSRRSPSVQRQREPEEEVAEPVVYLGAQTYGRVPSSCGTRASEMFGVSGRSSPHVKTSSTPNTSPRRDSPFGFRDEPLFTDDSRANSLCQDSTTLDSSPVSTSSAGAEMSDHGAPAPPTTLQATVFSPETPKAMPFTMDDTDTEAVSEKPLGKELPGSRPSIDSVLHRDESPKSVSVGA